MVPEKLDVIVVGAGHAGIEASLAAARLGCRTLLITTNLERIGYMSCNPSIGGLAKGHMVREIDVLGGEMGKAADATCIQFKRLNSSKGPAVRGTRTQNDKKLYSQFMSRAVFQQPNLSVLQSEVKSLILNGNRCEGVVLSDDSKIQARTVVITTGTFMNAVMHTGNLSTPGGRAGDPPTTGISDQLRSLGFVVRRLKTGTPPRLRKNSIDWSKTIPQYGDSGAYFPFSLHTSDFPTLPQIACFLSRTTEETHEIIRTNLHRSPMYCGIIEGVGPRYCPSIEDKIVRFADRTSHQTFLEPESLTSDLIYLQGISTSLPIDVQDRFLRTIPGLENVEVVRYGYAVEYDFIEPTQITHSLESRPISGLFLAGQINGTSGYEEAASQGFVAGVNAAHSVLNRREFILGRDQAYIGVLIDDLVTKGTKEPYRMFTSRAEHRLILREDNTFDRLADISKSLGLLSEAALERISNIVTRRESLLNNLRVRRLLPDEETQKKVRELGSADLTKPISLEEFLRRPEVSGRDLLKFDHELDSDPMVLDAVEIEVKYAGYVRRQMQMISQARKFEGFLLPDDLNYKLVRGLSTEEVQKLSTVRPRTLGQAQRISGVNPSAIQALMVHLRGASSYIKGSGFERNADATELES